MTFPGSEFDSPEVLAAKILREFHASAPPPVNVVAIARRLGATVSLEDLVEDGKLEFTANRPLIAVRRDAPPTRQRFTTAHEIGHLLHTEPNVGVARRTLTGEDAEERYCDAFAAALLMPRGWVIARYASAPHELATARGLAEVSRVSLSAAVVRLRELARWSKSLLHWRLVGGRWQLRTTAGIPRLLHGRVATAAHTRLLLNSIEATATRIRLPLTVAGVERVVEAEMERRGSAVVALVELEEADAGIRGSSS
jgi:hypothetical protein